MLTLAKIWPLITIEQKQRVLEGYQSIVPEATMATLPFVHIGDLWAVIDEPMLDELITKLKSVGELSKSKCPGGK